MARTLESMDTQLKRLNVGERLVRRNPFYYGSTRRQLDGLLDSDLDNRIAWTRMRLTKVLEAASRSPYGRTLGAGRSLSSWPLLDKNKLRDDFRAFCTGSTWFTARASTGGTTGTPVALVRSPAAVVAEQVCRDRMIRMLNVDPVSARVAVLRADSVKHPDDLDPPFWKYALGGRRLILSSPHLSSRTLPSYLAELRAFRPDLLWVHPSMLEVFCRLLMQARESFHVAGVLASSEVLSPQVWSLTRDLLGSEIVDCYGQAERVAYAYACRPNEYRFLPGYAHIELLERGSDEVGAYYEVVGTSLWNLAMPLVRYRTGDLIRVEGDTPDEQQLVEVAHGLRSFNGIVGRSRDVLLTPDERGIIPGLSYIPRGVPHLLRLQIAQETPRKIILRALTTTEFSSADAERLLANARSKIPNDASIELDVSGYLQRTAGGKAPFVVHSSDVQRALEALGMEAHGIKLQA